MEYVVRITGDGNAQYFYIGRIERGSLDEYREEALGMKADFEKIYSNPEAEVKVFMLIETKQ